MKCIVLPLALLLLQGCGRSDDSKSAPTISSESPPANSASQAAEQTANDHALIANDFTERVFQNPFDADAVYLLSQKSGTRRALNVLIKRNSQQGTQYSRWQFNCDAHTAQNFGVAENLEDLNKSSNSIPSAPKPYELKSRLGAIATAVCP